MRTPASLGLEQYVLLLVNPFCLFNPMFLFFIIANLLIILLVVPPGVIVVQYVTGTCHVCVWLSKQKLFFAIIVLKEGML